VRLEQKTAFIFFILHKTIILMEIFVILK
jgi:hypothetical protein